MALDPRSDLGTHEVANQPRRQGDLRLWQDDPILRDLLATTSVQADRLADYGAVLGSQEMRDAAREANRNPPELHVFDRGGRRLDEVAFHPSYHRFMQVSVEAGYHSVAWEGGAGGHLTHAAMVYLASQVEPGHCCPLTMTYAAVPVVAKAAGMGAAWTARLLSRDYDPSVRPVSAKAGATLGMAMTEKQGGSDLRSTATLAQREGEDWRLTGHKWFCSAPMSDGFLTLAQTEQGLTCFLVPRWLEEGRNGIRLQRLKDKLGNRSNASAEIEYVDALAWAVGAPGDGIRTIVEMVHHTRLDTAMAPTGLMRSALREACHWLSHRVAFQRRLIDQPLMRAVLADLALDWIGALALSLHVAGRFDSTDDSDRAFARIGVAIAKFSANKLCPNVVVEAMEMLGGMGYVEATMLPLLYREAPLNGIWEGSANVICLDVLRTLSRAPDSAEALRAEIAAPLGLDRRYDAAMRDFERDWRDAVPEEAARRFVEAAGLLLTASILLRTGMDQIAAAYIATRLTPRRGRISGAVSPEMAGHVLQRAFPDKD